MNRFEIFDFLFSKLHEKLKNPGLMGMILAAALLWKEPIDQAPEWIRIIHNANPETFRQDLPELLTWALASLEDECEHNDL